MAIRRSDHMRRFADDDDDVMRDYYWDGEALDGEHVRTSLMMKDADRLADHQPGYRISNDPMVVDARQRATDAYWEMVVRNERAWMDARRKPPPPDNDEDDDELEMADSRAKAAVARRQWVQKLQDAWRTPGRDAGAPDPGIASSRPWQGGEPDNSSSAEVMRRHLRTEPDDNVQARRDRAYADYCARVSQAWQHTNPTARANSVERQRQQWTGER
jgi:hypothetical protein